MIDSLGSRIAIFWLFLLIIFGFIRSAPAAIPPLHGGTLIEFQGKPYEVVSDPELHLVKVYTPNQVGPVPNELVLTIKRKSLPSRHVHLRLSSTTSETMIYTGMIPSRILLRGSLGFELTPRR